MDLREAEKYLLDNNIVAGTSIRIKETEVTAVFFGLLPDYYGDHMAVVKVEGWKTLQSYHPSLLEKL